MAATKRTTIQTNHGPLRIAYRPGERMRRRKSNAAQISDFLALKKAVLLCAACEARFPAKWGERYGYRKLHAFHTEGNCDYQGPSCAGYAPCTLYHYEEGAYCREWEANTRVLEAAKRQALTIRDSRRVKALDT